MRDLPGHSVESVPLIGWAGLGNGDLLVRADGVFDVFVTMDGALIHQQKISHRRLGIVTMAARSNEIETLRPLLPELRQAVLKVKPGQVIRVRG